jgi:hypothetical protein
MHLWENYQLSNMHRSELIREAERERLAQAALASQTSNRWLALWTDLREWANAHQLNLASRKAAFRKLSNETVTK